jgi:hypothetical protein
LIYFNFPFGNLPPAIAIHVILLMSERGPPIAPQRAIDWAKAGLEGIVKTSGKDVAIADIEFIQKTLAERRRPYYERKAA